MELFNSSKQQTGRHWAKEDLIDTMQLIMNMMLELDRSDPHYAMSFGLLEKVLKTLEDSLEYMEKYNVKRKT